MRWSLRSLLTRRDTTHTGSKNQYCTNTEQWVTESMTHCSEKLREISVHPCQHFYWSQVLLNNISLYWWRTWLYYMNARNSICCIYLKLGEAKASSVLLFAVKNLSPSPKIKKQDRKMSWHINNRQKNPNTSAPTTLCWHHPVTGGSSPSPARWKDVVCLGRSLFLQCDVCSCRDVKGSK